MIGEIIPVGEHLGRWMFVTRLTEEFVFGRVWKPLARKWTIAEVYYPRDTIDKKPPACSKPLRPVERETYNDRVSQ